MSMYNLIKTNDKSELAITSSKLISSYIEDQLKLKDRVQISLAGGSTPESTYKILSKSNINWSKIDIFLGDERWVDHENPASNLKMINNSLVSNNQVNKATIYPVPFLNCSTPEESASIYSDLLTSNCSHNPPSLDLCILGLGDDGHTASLFPGSSTLKISDTWVAATEGKGIKRITLTAPVLSASKQIIFIVSGSSKKLALKRLLDPNESFDRTPAKLVKSKSEIIIVADSQSL